MVKRFSILLMVLLFSATISAQAVDDKKTVEDYYKLISDNVFTDQLMRAEYEIKDTKSGYLKFIGGFEGWEEVALFRKGNRSPIIVVGSTGCGPICETTLTAYETYEDRAGNTQMMEVTEEILPRLSSREATEIFTEKLIDKEDIDFAGIITKLPREGRIIKVVGYIDGKDGEFTLYELHLKNDKFVISR